MWLLKSNLLCLVLELHLPKESNLWEGEMDRNLNEMGMGERIPIRMCGQAINSICYTYILQK